MAVLCGMNTAVSVICYLFTVSNPGLLFFHVGQPARRDSGVLGLPNIRHRTLPKIWVGFSYSPEE